MNPNNEDSSFKYWAAISYSHQDKEWGDWLHKSLETYRVPKNLIGKDSRGEPIPKRVFPVFRDREELPGSSNLGEEINQALKQSRNLIVICSPRSAASRWVHEEVRFFKTLGREDRIFCLIVDGEPNASDNPESGLLECFPKSIRFHVDEQGQLTEERTEPIAADARKGKDGKLNAKLKLLAGVLNVNYDELKQREKARRSWRRIQIAAGVFLVASIISAVWYQAHLEKREMEKARYRQLAEAMVKQTKDAIESRQEAVATLYGAHSVRYSLLAEQSPIEMDFLSSLSPPARLTQTIANADFSRGVAIHPQGNILASGSNDGAIRLWNTQTGHLLHTLKGHSAPVASVAFSPDGKHLASASEDRTLRIWDTTSWKETAVLRGHQDKVTSVAFHPDSFHLVSASWDKVIKLWDISGSALGTLKGHTNHVYRAVFSPDGKLIASGGKDNTLRLWDVEKQSLYTVLATYLKPVMDIAFSHDGRLLAAANRDRSTKVWDVASQKEIMSLGGHKLAVYGIAFSPDGDILAAASRDHSIKIWEISTRQELATLTGHQDDVNSVVFHPDGLRLFSGSLDKTLRVWHITARENFATLIGHDSVVRTVDYSPDGTLLVTGSDDKAIKVWDIAAQEVLHTFQGHTGSVRSVLFHPEGHLIASAGMDNTIRLWDLKTQKQVALVEGHLDNIMSLSFSPDGNQIASASWDHTIKLWEIPTLKEIGVLKGHEKEVNALQFSPDGKRLASAGYDGTVRIWDLATGKTVVTLKDQDKFVRTLAYSPDGKLLATGGWDRLIRLWDTRTYRNTGSLLAHHSYEVWHLRFSPDSKLLASATPSQDRHTIRLFDVEKRLLVSRLNGHDKYAIHLDFSPDGTILASGGTDATVRFWKVSDFWPKNIIEDAENPGALLRHFLETPPYQVEEIDQIIEEIESMTGYELVGTVAMPLPDSNAKYKLTPR